MKHQSYDSQGRPLPWGTRNGFAGLMAQWTFTKFQAHTNPHRATRKRARTQALAMAYGQQSGMDNAVQRGPAALFDSKEDFKAVRRTLVTSLLASQWPGEKVAEVLRDFGRRQPRASAQGEQP